MQKIISHEETDQQIQEDEDSIESTAVNSAEESSDENEPLKKVDSKTPRKFVEDELREKGRVKTTVYMEYMKASGGLPFWLVCVVAYAVAQVLVTGECRRTLLVQCIRSTISFNAACFVFRPCDWKKMLTP